MDSLEEQLAISAAAHVPCTAYQALRLRAQARCVASPSQLGRLSAQQRLRNVALVGAGSQSVDGPEEQDPPASPCLRPVKRLRESASLAEGDQAPQREERPFRRCDPPDQEAEPRPPVQRSRHYVDPNGPKSVRNEQMLTAPRSPHDKSPLSHLIEVEHVRLGSRRARLGRQHRRMQRGGPERPRQRRGELGRFEQVQPPGFRFCRQACLWERGVRTRGRHGGRGAISRIPPEPFPGEDGAVGLEQRDVSRGISPVCLCTMYRHTGIKAGRAPLTHSPIWGNCVTGTWHNLQPPDEERRKLLGAESRAIYGFRQFSMAAEGGMDRALVEVTLAAVEPELGKSAVVREPEPPRRVG